MMNFDEAGVLRSPDINETLHWDASLGRTNLYTNGDFELGTSQNFWGGLSIETDDPQSGTYYAKQNIYAGWQSSEFVPVDTGQEYEISLWAKTFSRGSDGNLSRGHMGFACYDKNKSFIDLRNCGGLGNTRLSRELRPGDQYAYFESNSGWYSGTFEEVSANRAYYRWVLFFPPDHPDYSQEWFYTRINPVAYQEMIQMPEGDWRVTLSSYRSSGTLVDAPVGMPDIGYPLPAGTPVSRGAAGGSYNYALGTGPYPEEWKQFKTTIPANTEVRNSDRRFRPGTKYIKFLILGNYYARSGSITTKPVFGLDNIALTCVSTNQANTFTSFIELEDQSLHVQDIVELGGAPVDNVLGYIDDATLYIANEIIEE